MIAMQRDGVRLVVFYKCASTSLQHMFVTGKAETPTESLQYGSLFCNTLEGQAYMVEAEKWVEPVVTIAFFRHPLARLASMWNHLIMNSAITLFKAIGFRKDMSFREFLEEVLRRKDTLKDPHYDHQHVTLEECGGKTGEMWIQRVEDLPGAWVDTVKLWALDCTDHVAWFNSIRYPDEVKWLQLYIGNEDLVTELLDMYALDLHIWRTRAVT